MSLMINQGTAHFSAPVPSRPIRSELSMLGINIGIDTTNRAARTSGVFDGKNLWMAPISSKSPLLKYSLSTGQYKLIDNNVQLLGPCGVFDGNRIWYLPYMSSTPLVAVDVKTESMTVYPKDNGSNGNVNLPDQLNAHSGIYDGKYIWFVNPSPHYLIKLNPDSGTMTGYPLGVFKTHKMIYGSGFIWLYGTSVNDGTKLFRIDPTNISIQTYSIIDYKPSDIADSFCYDGKNIWMELSREKSNLFIKFNIDTHEINEYEIKDAVNGNHNLGNVNTSAARITSLTCDGKYIWCISSLDNQIIKVDCVSGTMSGQKLSGSNLGNYSQVENAFYECSYDGKNIWLIPYAANRLIKITSADDPTHTVTEEYEDASGTPIRPGAYRWITPGDPYTGTAPVINGYTYRGYKIDGGEVQSGHTATIPDVQADHIITFVYQGQDENQDLGITERYLNVDGTPLLPDTFVPMESGDDYESVAPRLTGYKRTGHQIDSGAHLTTRTARIPDVQQSHTVTFTYEPCDGEKCQDILITESYLDTTTGQAIQADTYSYVAQGDDYQQNAPVLPGYRRTGHRVDGGADSTSLFVYLEGVQEDHHVFFLYEPGEDQELPSYRVTEQYYDAMNDAFLRPDTFTTAEYGDSYWRAAPAIGGYRRTGWRLDGGPDQPGFAADIPLVAQDHTVTFLYEPLEEGGHEDDQVITEEYYDVGSGRYIRPDSYSVVAHGGSYTKSQPYVSRYRRVGHRIDGGTEQASLTARISPVAEDHTVTFLYEAIDGLPEEDRLITESFYDVINDEYIRPDFGTLVILGEDYIKGAPAITGYTRVGHRIDGGPDQASPVAVIRNVTADHQVTFLYRPADEGIPEDYQVITEEYYDVANGEYIAPHTATAVLHGGSYRKTAPLISRYRRVGHQIDGGPELPSLTARISPVVADHTVTFLYELIPGGTGDDERIITESYYDTVNGEYIKADTYSVVKVGADYAKGAPAIQGYQRTGHCIDGGPDSTRLTAVIEDVQDNHQVTFLYGPTEEGGKEDRLVITESYLDTTTGERIQPDTYTVGRYGGTYSKTAPVLEGYQRTGHRIDDGVDSTGLTATIQNVTQDHHVFFLYQPGEDNGGGGNGNGDGDGGKCCCKCMPMMPCIPVMMMPVMPCIPVMMMPVMPCMPMQWPNCCCCCKDPDGEKPTDPGPGTDPDDEDDCEF